MNLGYLEDVFTAAFNADEPPSLPQWIEWQHVSEGITHCEVCLTLDQRWFLANKKPMLPQHQHCHCTAEPLSYGRVMKEATSTCRYSKFDPYLFDREGTRGHGKDKVFKSWGYSIEDSEWLRQEIERQGLEKYIAGLYTQGQLDKNGQRIDIRVEIPRKDKEKTVSFITGWMVDPVGHIRLNTPYGGK